MTGRECQTPQDCQTHQYCRSASNGTPRPPTGDQGRAHSQPRRLNADLTGSTYALGIGFSRSKSQVPITTQFRRISLSTRYAILSRRQPVPGAHLSPVFDGSPCSFRMSTWLSLRERYRALWHASAPRSGELGRHLSRSGFLTAPCSRDGPTLASRSGERQAFRSSDYWRGGGARTAMTTSRCGPGLRIECSTPEGARAPSPADRRSSWSPT